MRRTWSEAEKRRLMRRVWVALAEAQYEAGLVTAMQLADLRARQDQIDIERAQQIEEEIRHDLMAEIRTYAEQCPVGGPIIHLGATSMDILDNVDALRLRTALDQIIERLKRSLATLAARIAEEADTPAIAFTHIQPAEPTTVGYRFAQHGQDLLADLEELQRVRNNIRGKGMKGAVGTSASYTQLLSDSDFTPPPARRTGDAEAGPARLRGRHPDLPSQTGLARCQRHRWALRQPPQVRFRPPNPPVAPLRRME